LAQAFSSGQFGVDLALAVFVSLIWCRF